MTLIRISKLLSEQGICSRREADSFIEKGFVYVDGVKVTQLGTKARTNQKIELRGKGKIAQSEKKTILLNKPINFVSHADDEKKYTSALTLITPNNYHGRESLENSFFNLAPAGRLDIESTGLIILTEDGVVAKKIIDANSSVEKEYLVRVSGDLKKNGLQLLNYGLKLDDKLLKKAKVSWINDNQLKFILTEGKKRQIRRMCGLVGLDVIGLKRVRIGSVMLGDLPLGKWRFLKKNESF